MDQIDKVQAVVRKFYDAEAAYMASKSPDFTPVAEALSADILLCEPVSLPCGGEYRGHAAFEHWLRTFANTWSSMEVRVSEMFSKLDFGHFRLGSMRLR